MAIKDMAASVLTRLKNQSKAEKIPFQLVLQLFVQEEFLRKLSLSQYKDNLILKGDLVDALKRVYDIERLIGKISYGNANARDMVSLKNSVGKLPDIKILLGKTESKMLKNLYEELDELKDVY